MKHENAEVEWNSQKPYICAEDVVIPEPERELIPGLLAYGKVTAVRGNTGSGLTSFSMGIAAEVSNGGYITEDYHATHAPRSGNVLILSIGDTANEIAAMLDGNRGVLSSCYIVTDTNDCNINSDKLAALIAKLKPALVVVDQLPAFVGNVDTENKAQMSEVWHGFCEVLKQNNCAALVTMYADAKCCKKIVQDKTSDIPYPLHASVVLSDKPVKDYAWRTATVIRSRYHKPLGPILYAILENRRVEFSPDGQPD